MVVVGKERQLMSTMLYSHDVDVSQANLGSVDNFHDHYVYSNLHFLIMVTYSYLFHTITQFGHVVKISIIKCHS